MTKDIFQTTVICILPGTSTVTFVVRDSVDEQEVEQHLPSFVPAAAPLLVLAQLLNSCLPNSEAKFHAWQCYKQIQANLETFSVQMANVPAVDEDELPF